MREAILILIVLAVLFGLTAYRYRRQISTMLQVWRMMKSMRSVGSARENVIEEKEDIGNLVSCAKCGTWVPEIRAVGLGKKTFYCSTACLEKSARVN